MEVENVTGQNVLDQKNQEVQYPEPKKSIGHFKIREHKLAYLELDRKNALHFL